MCVSVRVCMTKTRHCPLLAPAKPDHADSALDMPRDSNPDYNPDISPTSDPHLTITDSTYTSFNPLKRTKVGGTLTLTLTITPTFPPANRSNTLPTCASLGHGHATEYGMHVAHACEQERGGAVGFGDKGTCAGGMTAVGDLGGQGNSAVNT